LIQRYDIEFVEAEEDPEYVDEDERLDSMTVPFHLDFGDAGIGYAYISEDGRSGKFCGSAIDRGG